MSARQRILARIARGLERAPRDAADPGLAEYVRCHPRGPQPQWDGGVLSRFEEQAARLSSEVTRVPGPEQVPAALASYLAAAGLPRQAVCWPQLAHLPWADSGLRVAARAAQADDLVGISGAFCAIAETGTLMLLSGADTPATVSLLPETHVAVLAASRIVPSMEDAWDRVRAERRILPRAVNFVSGPSRTADIEQTVTLGAHGPYRVLIVLMTEV